VAAWQAEIIKGNCNYLWVFAPLPRHREKGRASIDNMHQTPTTAKTFAQDDRMLLKKEADRLGVD